MGMAHDRWQGNALSAEEQRCKTKVLVLVFVLVLDWVSFLDTRCFFVKHIYLTRQYEEADEDYLKPFDLRPFDQTAVWEWRMINGKKMLCREWLFIDGKNMQRCA